MVDRFSLLKIAAFAGFIAFLFLGVYSQVYKTFDIPIQVMGALLGAIVTAFITLTLLQGQSKAEEIKERNVKVFENKVSNFMAFIELLWEKWSDFRIEPEEFNEIRKNFYSKVFIYLQNKNLEKLKNHFDALSSREILGQELTDEQRLTATRHVFGIISILKSEIGLERRFAPELLTELDKIFTRGEYLAEKIEINHESSNYAGLGFTFWHLTAWDTEEQLQLLKGSAPYLVLGDSEENGPRTALLTSVRANDVIALYIRGRGYVGLFRAMEDGKAMPPHERTPNWVGNGSEGRIYVDEIFLLRDSQESMGYDVVRRRAIQRISDPKAIHWQVNTSMEKLKYLQVPIPAKLTELQDKLSQLKLPA